MAKKIFLRRSGQASFPAREAYKTLMNTLSQITLLLLRNPPSELILRARSAVIAFRSAIQQHSSNPTLAGKRRPDQRRRRRYG